MFENLDAPFGTKFLVMLLPIYIILLLMTAAIGDFSFLDAENHVEQHIIFLVCMGYVILKFAGLFEHGGARSKNVSLPGLFLFDAMTGWMLAFSAGFVLSVLEVVFNIQALSVLMHNRQVWYTTVHLMFFVPLSSFLILYWPFQFIDFLFSSMIDLISCKFKNNMLQ